MANYFGASLPAMVKISAQKGYRLVGTNRYGYNAFFIRNEIQNPHLSERLPEDSFEDSPLSQKRLEVVKALPWEDV